MLITHTFKRIDGRADGQTDGQINGRGQNIISHDYRFGGIKTEAFQRQGWLGLAVIDSPPGKSHFTIQTIGEQAIGSRNNLP